MLERFLVVLGQVITLFLLMGVGFLLGKLKKISSNGTGEMSVLLMYVVTPCVIINSFQGEFDPELLHTLTVGSAALLGCYVLYILVIQLFFRREKTDLGAPLRFGAMYGNTGFMGLPLVMAVLGEEAVIFAVVSMVIFNLVAWTHGVMMMGGRGAFSLRKVFINPGVIGTAIGLPLFLTHSALPGSLGAAAGFLADLNTPLAMVVIGAQMARADLASTFRQYKLYIAAGVKLILMPLLTALVLLPLGLDPLFYSATVILSAAPTAGITSMFAERFGRDVERSAQLVSLCTLLSVVTLPAMAVVAETLAG